MNSSKTKIKIEAVVAVVGAALLAGGCSSTHEQASNSSPAPVVSSYPSSSGGTGDNYDTQAGGAVSATNNMVIPLQKEQVNVGTQQVAEGSVRIRKIVKTETVSQPVQIRTESVSVERVAGGGQVESGSANSLSTPFKEGEVVINLTKEQPFVSTQVVPAGSVVIKKQVSTQSVSIQHQVRSEDVAAVPTGNLENIHISSNVTPAANEAAGAPPSASEQSSGAGGTITQLDQLTASSSGGLAGQQVNLSAVPVQKVIGTWLLAVGPASGSPIYVRVSEPPNGISAGDTISINGVVEQVPSSTSSLGLDQQSSQALDGQKIMINAKSVSRTPQ